LEDLLSSGITRFQNIYHNLRVRGPVVRRRREKDLDDPPKWERLQQWSADATAHDGKRSFHALFVSQEEWDAHRPGNFDQLVKAFG
jgi:hypothetical protein